jgi:ferritin-like metal-binding protein YciE
MNSEFNTLYISKIKKAWDMEDQLVRALPKMAEQATSKDLHDALLQHLDETIRHRDRLGEVLAQHEEAQIGEPNPAFEQLLAEAEMEVANISDYNVRDAFIIAEARTVEHIEMSKYMTLIDWANEMSDTDALDAFDSNLGDEQAAEQKMTNIATGGLLGLMGENVNEKAVAAY